MYGSFKVPTIMIRHEMTRALQRRRNFKRESESLLIMAQNKVKIDNMQQNSKCRLCGDKNETV